MHRFVLLSVDLILIAAATVFALALRENLELPLQRFIDLVPYLALTLGVSVPVLVLVGLNRSLWRFSSLEDCLWAAGACVAIVVLSVALGFAINRLEGVARSLPILQVILMVCALTGARVAMRLRHMRRARGKGAGPALGVSHQQESVLVVGLNAVTELFLQSVQEFGGERIKVTGLLGRGERHRGRLLRLHPVLGLPEEIDRVLTELEVHGVMIQRLVITTKFDALSPAAQEALLRVERTSDIALDFFAERVVLNGGGWRGPGNQQAAIEADQRAAAALEVELAALASRPYLRYKRALDVVFAAALIICLAPLAVVLGIILSMSIGPPPIFWQQRPGALGRPFRLLKFRTMGPAHDPHGTRISDAERTSGIGWLLRRTRLDELPQLYNILIGEMSFVGPRPLLPVDQSPGSELRLLVRPGLTGWAQIKGGRELTASDKAALDMWYVRHASFGVDVKILAGTLSMLVFGDAVDRRALSIARHELGHDSSPHSDHIYADSAQLQTTARDINGGVVRSAAAQAQLARRRV